MRPLYLALQAIRCFEEEEAVTPREGQPLRAVRPDSVPTASTLPFSLEVATWVRDTSAGYAAHLVADTGQTLWSTTGSVCLASLDPSFLPAKAFLQGVRLGLHHAESLGIVSLKYPVPSASLISQILDSELPRSSGIWAEIAEIAAYCTRFPTSAEYNWEVLEMHHPLMQAARSFSLPCSQGPKDCDKLAIPYVSKQEHCAICLCNQDVELMHVTGDCKHTFCTDCLATYVKHEVADRSFPVQCPHPDCTTGMSMPDCRFLLLYSAKCEKLAELEREKAIPANQRFYCPNPDCSYLMRVEQGKPGMQLSCEACHRRLCVSCGTNSHLGLSCVENKAGSPQDRALLQLAARHMWTPCPLCRQFVERSSGCEHMTCRCGAQFCYRCGASYLEGCQANCGQWTGERLQLEKVRIREQYAARSSQPSTSQGSQAQVGIGKNAFNFSLNPAVQQPKVRRSPRGTWMQRFGHTYEDDDDDSSSQDSYA